MINIRSILKLAENDGMTLKKATKLPIKAAGKLLLKASSAKPHERQ